MSTFGEDDLPALPTPEDAESWVDVVALGERVYARVNVDRGATSSTHQVRTRREVEDIAARYGIARTDVRWQADPDVLNAEAAAERTDDEVEQEDGGDQPPQG